MGIDPAPCCANMFLYFFESKCLQHLISKRYPCAYNFIKTSRFIDSFCTINDDGDFSSPYKYIYPNQLKLKLEHQRKHVALLYLDITFEDDVSVYKFFDKRDKSLFFILGTLYQLSNIQSSIFYGSIYE